jgi:hypothetical protein
MKKINVILLSIIFTAGTLNASFLPAPNPYVIGPEGRTVEDLRDFARPNQMFAIMPNRPIVATDASGARQYFTPNGQLALSVSKDGSTTFSLQGTTKTKDSEGNLTSVSRNIAGTNMIEVTNEFQEVISYKETGLGGKVVREYDKDNNVTKTFNYDAYGKNITSIVNEMTKGRTIFDEKGLATYDLDYEGNRMAKYEYDDSNRLASKTDVYGNVSTFDGNGAMIQTVSKDGDVLSRYNYKYDDKGNYTLESVFDPSTKNTTYFENGKQTVTKNHAGAVVTDYVWDGSKMVYSFDRESQQTTWYDRDGKTLYTSYNNQMISKNLYYKGQLVGIWDVRSHQVTVLKNERRELAVSLGNNGKPSGTYEYEYTDADGNTTTISGPSDVEFDEVIEPTAEDVKMWLDLGIVDKKFMVNPL